jgi:hypothetical protein
VLLDDVPTIAPFLEHSRPGAADRVRLIARREVWNVVSCSHHGGVGRENVEQHLIPDPLRVAHVDADVFPECLDSHRQRIARRENLPTRRGNYSAVRRIETEQSLLGIRLGEVVRRLDLSRERIDDGLAFCRRDGSVRRAGSGENDGKDGETKSRHASLGYESLLPIALCVMTGKLSIHQSRPADSVLQDGRPRLSSVTPAVINVADRALSFGPWRATSAIRYSRARAHEAGRSRPRRKRA